MFVERMEAPEFTARKRRESGIVDGDGNALGEQLNESIDFKLNEMAC